MPRITYTEKKFSAHVLAAITVAVQITEEYAAEGYRLTLRQLYYQFVARDLLANTFRSYKNLGNWISDARLAGLIDWTMIEDRRRNLEHNSHWTGPKDLLESAAQSYGIDTWSDQPLRVEVWVEKEALAGVVERPASRWDVAWFCCVGYNSQSEMWNASQRFLHYADEGQDGVILYLGDHDPSGMDMARDIQDRLDLFCEGEGPEVIRIALNMDQIEEHKPPPNPTKLTDSRAIKYKERFGTEFSWELDALDPRVLDALIDAAIQEHADTDRLSHRWDQREEERKQLYKLAERFQ